MEIRCNRVFGAPDPLIELDYLPTVLPIVGDYIPDDQGKFHRVYERAFNLDKGLLEIFIYAESTITELPTK